MEITFECTEDDVTSDRPGSRVISSPSQSRTSFTELDNFATKKDPPEFQYIIDLECETVDPRLVSFEASKKRIMKSPRSKLFFLLELCTVTVCIASLIYSTAYGMCYNDYVCFRNLMFGSFVFGFSFFLLIVVHNDLFQTLVEEILQKEICGKLKLQVMILASFLIVGFTDFLLLSISASCEVGEIDCNDPLLDPHAGNGEIRHITRTLTAVCAILFALSVLAYWDHIRYICAHYAWVHAILYLTIVGGVFLEIARCLVKPIKKAGKGDVVDLNWSWHSRHPTTEILDWIMLIVLVLVTMFVWLAAIIVALFTEIANESQEWGVYWATLIYCTLALMCGITPLAPGSVADAVGGFLLVKIYMNEGFNFFEAIFLASTIVTILHFCGSCLQYWIGKMKPVQAWANFALPPDILAASDSVLLEANCMMVGIVGQVFMDTFNGLNQGRMGMDFCTQFWSEYASLPTAYSWVATGAVLSVQGVPGYEWAADVIPICLLLTATWQFLGTTFGGWKLLNASKDEMFWKNKEKWETVQYFFKLGAKATKQGWKNDCFCLAERCEGIELPLFERIAPIHGNYIEKALSPQKSVNDCKINQKIYNNKRSTERNKHWEELKHKFFEKNFDGDGKLRLKKQYNDWFVTHMPIDDATDESAWMKKKLFCNCTYQLLLVIAAVLLAMYSYRIIASDIETDEAVQQGIQVLKGTGVFEWVIFALYNVLVLTYYSKGVINSMKSGLTFIRSALCCECCKVLENTCLETTFKPTWNKPHLGINNVPMA